MKYISRRKALNFLGSAGLILYLPQFAQASTEMVSGAIEEIIDGKDSVNADIYLDLPEIAENGNQVKLSFEIDSPMTDDNFVRFVHVLADGNPAPKVAKFMFTPSAGVCSATTRMRLAKTQNVYLLAEFSNGSYAMAQSTVKVTIGGCGG
ncbi:MAG: thiosulfate oxidation carrier protein SoxY [Paracoccaceae bacterium]